MRTAQTYMKRHFQQGILQNHRNLEYLLLCQQLQDIFLLRQILRCKYPLWLLYSLSLDRNFQLPDGIPVRLTPIESYCLHSDRQAYMLQRYHIIQVTILSKPRIRMLIVVLGRCFTKISKGGIRRLIYLHLKM